MYNLPVQKMYDPEASATDTRVSPSFYLSLLYGAEWLPFRKETNFVLWSVALKIKMPREGKGRGRGWSGRSAGPRRAGRQPQTRRSFPRPARRDAHPVADSGASGQRQGGHWAADRCGPLRTRTWPSSCTTACRPACWCPCCGRCPSASPRRPPTPGRTPQVSQVTRQERGRGGAPVTLWAFFKADKEANVQPNHWPAPLSGLESTEEGPR